MILINTTAEKEIQININIDSTLRPLPHIAQETFKLDDKPRSVNSVRIVAKIKPSTNSFEQIQVSAMVPFPLSLSINSILFRNVLEEKMFETYCYIDEDKFGGFNIYSVELKILVSYVNTQGLPRILQKTLSIPLNLVYNLTEPVKEAKFKVTLNISHQATPLNQLFPGNRIRITLIYELGNI